MTTKNFKTLHIWDTIYNADSVEWCPIPSYKHFFVCGLYHLEEKNTDNECGYERSGGIVLFNLLKDKLEEVHKINSPAVLDLKWCWTQLNDKIALAAANAAGEVCLYYFEDKKLVLISKCLLKKVDGDFLTLSLDWIKGGFPDKICASDSKGNLSLIQVSNDELHVLKVWNSHSLEVWIICCDSFCRNIFYSGGDEGDLKVWDLRSEEPCQKSSSKHNAGVTALTTNPYKEHNLVSGSYDETICFWDTRKMKRPCETIGASGGVWRLKWEPKTSPVYLLAACIYGGFQIYNGSSYSLVGEYKEHESLAYGASWCYLNNKEVKDLLECNESALIATCSFYDHKLCVSLWDENVTV